MLGLWERTKSVPNPRHVLQRLIHACNDPSPCLRECLGLGIGESAAECLTDGLGLPEGEAPITAVWLRIAALTYALV